MEDLGDVLLQLVASCADRVEDAIDDLIEHLLAFHITDTAVGIGSLELVKVLELRPEVGEVLISGKSVEIGEDGIALHMTRVRDVEVCGVGIHALDLLPHGIGVIREIDAVA